MILDYLVLCKTEVTNGTDAVPTAAANALRTIGRAIPALNLSNIQRGIIKQSFGDMPHIIDQNGNTTLTLEVELKGSGTAGTAPDWSPLMKACGNIEVLPADANGVVGTVKYSPRTQGIEKCTIYVYIDGTLWKMVGAVGTCSITGNIGELPKASFSMTSPHMLPVNAAVPAGAAFDPSVPHVISTTDVVGDGGTIKVGSFGIDLGVDVQEHKTIGGHEFNVSGRAPTASISKDSVSTITEWTSLLSNTQVSLTATFNGGVGNNVNLTANKAVRDSVAFGERAEKDLLDVAYNLYETTSDDQWTMVIT